MRNVVILLMLISSSFVLAGKRDEFVKKVVSECQISSDDAKKLATPGRTGNVIKVLLCPENPVQLADNCSVSCSTTKGNVVGN